MGDAFLENMENLVKLPPSTLENIEKIKLSDYILVDLEATADEPVKIPSRIIEIGAVKVINGEVIETYKEYVQPNDPELQKLTPFIMELTGISQEQVDSGLSAKEALIDFGAFVGELPVISWSKYDYTQLAKETIENGLAADDYTWSNPDTTRDLRVDLVEVIGTLARSNNKNKMRFGMKRAISKLNHMYNLGFEIKGHHHDALDDVETLLQIAKLIYR
jgi:inhibitor of KinA sporulation pathway (predicted exonuclease)